MTRPIPTAPKHQNFLYREVPHSGDSKPGLYFDGPER
jgi:hypothetical protein